MVHKKKDLTKVNANSLLSFGYDEEDTKKKKQMEAPTINDEEGVDFGFYFSTKYQMIHGNKHKDKEHRPATANRGRGRGRGERDERTDSSTHVKNEQIKSRSSKNSLAG